METPYPISACQNSELATAFGVSFRRALPSKAHILSRVSRMSDPLLAEISSSLQSLQKKRSHLNTTESHRK